MIELGGKLNQADMGELATLVNRAAVKMLQLEDKRSSKHELGKAHVNLGCSYYLQNMLEDALQSTKIGCEILFDLVNANPKKSLEDLIFALKNQAAILQRLGRTDDAIHTCQQYMDTLDTFRTSLPAFFEDLESLIHVLKA